MLKGEPSTMLAAKLEVSYKTVLKLRPALQANAVAMQPDSPLPDNMTETDEMFQNAGKKAMNTSTRMTRRVVERISGADVARMPMTVHLYWEPLVEKPVKCAGVG